MSRFTLGITLSLLVLVPAAPAGEAGPAPEVHRLHVRAGVEYRCYGGYPPGKVKDSRTGLLCDNKTYPKVLLDKDVSIKIQFEPNPGGDQGLVGVWSETVPFMGRDFVVAMTLFKEPPSGRARPTYRLRLVAEDGEPLTRQSATFAEFRRREEMNALSIDYESRGTPEEIRYEVRVEPVVEGQGDLPR